MAQAALQIDTKERDLGLKTKYLLSHKLVPGVFYSHGKTNEHFTVDFEELRKLYKKSGSNTIIKVKLPSGNVENALIKEVQLDPIMDTPTHVDFFGLQMKEKLTANIPLEFIGESAAVKNFGGVLVTSVDELEVRCLPSDLVHHIEVDLSTLAEIGDSIHISMIAIPKGMEVLAEDDLTVISVQPPVDNSAEPEEVPEMNVADVEVTTAKQPTEGEESSSEE